MLAFMRDIYEVVLIVDDTDTLQNKIVVKIQKN